MLVIRSSGRVVQGVAALPHRRWLILINDMTTKLTFNSYARMLVCESPWLEISKTRAVVSKTLNQKSGQCRGKWRRCVVPVTASDGQSGQA